MDKTSSTSIAYEELRKRRGGLRLLRARPAAKLPPSSSEYGSGPPVEELRGDRQTPWHRGQGQGCPQALSRLSPSPGTVALSRDSLSLPAHTLSALSRSQQLGPGSASVGCAGLSDLTWGGGLGGTRSDLEAALSLLPFPTWCGTLSPGTHSLPFQLGAATVERGRREGGGGR